MKYLIWFRAIDYKLWGDDANPNTYFATVSLMISALCGAAIATISAYQMVYSSSSAIDMTNLGTASAYLLLVISMLNIGESIFCCRKVWQMMVRSLILVVMVPLMAVIGFIASAIVYIVIVLAVALFLFSCMALGGGKSGGKKKYVLDDGTTVTEEKGLLGESYYSGDNGASYTKSPGSDSFTRNY